MRSAGPGDSAVGWMGGGKYKLRKGAGKGVSISQERGRVWECGWEGLLLLS